MFIKNGLIVLGIILFAYVSNFALYKASAKYNSNKNGFSRSHQMEYIHLTDSFAFPKGMFRIAGLTDKTLFISTLRPGYFQRVNLETGQLTIDSVSGINVPPVNIYNDTKIDSPNIFISIGNYNRIYKGNFTTKQITDSAISPYLFIRSCFTSDTTVALCAFDTSKSKDQLFVKYNFSDRKFARSNETADNGRDAINNDGLLRYDKKNAELLYIYFYQSRVSLFNADLSIKGTIHTVDTFNNFSTHGSMTDMGNGKSLYTNQTPKYDISSLSYVYNGKVYIISSLRADNETEEDFKNNAVFDVYDTQERKYLYSFMIPQQRKDLIRDFIVRDNKLVILYGRSISVYDLNV